MAGWTDFLNLFKWDTNNSEDLDSNFDIDKALNDNWTKINDGVKKLNDDKVDKVTGKGLSTKDFTADYETKLKGLSNYDDTAVKKDISTNKTNIATNSQDISTLKNNISNIENEIDNIQSTRGHVYGIKRKISNNSSNKWERTDDAVGLVANAQKGTTAVQNDFDSLAPWSEIKTCNYDITNKKILAYIGDPDFKFDGSNGDVYTQIPDFWYKIWQDNDYDYIQIADYARAGFTKSNKFLEARYHMGLVDGTLHSYSGLTPANQKTIGAFRTLAKALGDEFCLLDYRQFIINILFLVEYATYHSQSVLGNGFVSMRYNSGDVALVAENNTNRFIVNTTAGNSFYVGQTISIGTSGTGNYGVATDRKITAINNYEEGSVTGKEIIFDGDPVNIALTNVIWSSPQFSGSCDSLGMISGCLVNDSKHGVIYRGIENPFGNLWAWVDGINIKDYQAYLCKDPSQYVSDKFEEPYKKLGYVDVNANGWSKTLGFDTDEPLVRFPTEIGAADSTYQCDYHWTSSGNRVALVGGILGNGTNCGLWYWFLYYSSSYSHWSIGCRVLINQ
jgi:hypothetical protein